MMVNVMRNRRFHTFLLGSGAAVCLQALFGSLLTGPQASGPWNSFAVIQAIRHDTQRQGFDLRNSFRLGLSVSHHSRKIRNFREPAAIVFSFNFDLHNDTDIIRESGRECPSETPRHQRASDWGGELCDRLFLLHYGAHHRRGSWLGRCTLYVEEETMTQLNQRSGGPLSALARQLVVSHHQ